MSPSASSTSNSNSNGHSESKFDMHTDIVSSNLSTSALEHKLRQLREESNQLNQELTQKLASSQSGQNLLHIGSSLSTLPPDLHSLLTQLHPVLSGSEVYEKTLLVNLQQLTTRVTEIRTQQQRSLHAAECADLYTDLAAAESKVKSSRYAFDNANAKRDVVLLQLHNEDHDQDEFYDDDDDDDGNADLGGDRISGKSSRVSSRVKCQVKLVQAGLVQVSHGSLLV
jgi:hypothetical protein